MRYRALDSDGDYQFGRAGLYLTDSPEAVRQAIITRLRLQTGEWFVDTTAGTPYKTQVLGYSTQPTRDIVMKERIVDTAGVRTLLSYSSSLNSSRLFTVNATVDTIYGAVSVTTSIGA